jgi:integrase/recombinase XerC
MASLTIAPYSPYWIARMRVWIAAPETPSGGFWRLTMRSTKLPHKTTPKRTAKAFADEMERTARELRSVKPTEQWYAQRVDSLIRLANVASPRKSVTWTKAAESWIEAKTTAKPKTIDKYRTDIAHFARWLGVRASHNLRDITPDDISAFFRDLKDKGYSDNTAALVIGTIRSIFRRAVLLRQIDLNPAELLTISRTDAAKRRSFTPEEIGRILAAIKDDAEWTTACLFGLYYGMRLWDACNRSYEEIDGGVLRFVPQKKSRKGKVVAVPLVGQLSILRGEGKITPTLAKLTVSVASGQFSRILDKAGIVRSRQKATGKGRGVVDATFHSWRHTTNSLLVDAGVDQKVRQMICDHDTVEMSNRYTHASIETMTKALTPLAAIASSQTPQGPHTSAP